MGKEEYNEQMLPFDEAANFLGISKSTLYKRTSNRDIPHYKPSGKLIYFKKKELVAWMCKNRIAANEELSERASSFRFPANKGN
jgi:excisionase family DNA binding protein